MKNENDINYSVDLLTRSVYFSFIPTPTSEFVTGIIYPLYIKNKILIKRRLRKNMTNHKIIPRQIAIK